MAKSKMTTDQRRKLGGVARRLTTARAKEAAVWDEARELIIDIYGQTALGKEGPTYEEIARIFGVTKARIYQLVTGNRGTPTKDVKAYKKAS